MSRLAILAAMVAAAIIASIVIAAAGSAQAPGERTLTFTETNKGSTFGLVDNPPRSKLRGQRASISIGDMFVFTNPLVGADKQRAGSIAGFCVATKAAKRFERGIYACTAFAGLAGGTIQVGARFNPSANNFGVAGTIAGGTGAYEGARGTFSSKGQPSKDTFHILP